MILVVNQRGEAQVEKFEASWRENPHNLRDTDFTDWYILESLQSNDLDEEQIVTFRPRFGPGFARRVRDSVRRLFEAGLIDRRED